jgi:aspartate aminotransferase-like enzyme
MCAASKLVLDLIEERGLKLLFKDIETRAIFTRTFAQKMGFKIFAEKPSSSLTALTVPMTIDSQVVRQRLEEKHHITIMGGQDQVKGKILRIGHMGYIQPKQMVELMMKLGETMNHYDDKLCTPSQMKAMESEMRQFWGLS